MTKTIDIIYGASLKQVQGVNYVNSSFVQGKDIFEQNGLKLRFIVTSEEVFECNKHDKLDTMGVGMQTKRYAMKRLLRKVLKFVFSSNTLFGAIVKYYFNIYLPNKAAARRYLSIGLDSDYILFQGFFEAYYYFTLAGEKSKNVKTVWMNHGDGSAFSMIEPEFPAIFRHKRITKILFYDMYNYALEYIDKVVFLSKKAADACKDVENGKKTYIYNGESDLPKITLKQTSHKVEIVCVGSINYRKGQDRLLQALMLLPEDVKERIRVNIIGGGPQLQELHTFTELNKLDKYVKFWGVRNDVPVILKDMDLFCLPSSNEGMPMVIIEAMRQGLYILGTDTGGIKEMIQPEYGRIISQNPENIAETITDIVRHGRITDEARRASRKAYETHFTLKQNIDSFSFLFKSL